MLGTEICRNDGVDRREPLGRVQPLGNVEAPTWPPNISCESSIFGAESQDTRSTAAILGIRGPRRITETESPCVVSIFLRD